MLNPLLLKKPYQKEKFILFLHFLETLWCAKRPAIKNLPTSEMVGT